MIAFLSGKTQIKDDSGIVFKATVHQFGLVLLVKPLKSLQIKMTNQLI